MKPSYDQILDIMHRTMNEVVMAGHDLNLCVWELSPSIRRTIRDGSAASGWMVIDFSGDGKESFHGIPIRRGVSEESTGILLKQVHLNPWG